MLHPIQAQHSTGAGKSHALPQIGGAHAGRLITHIHRGEQAHQRVILRNAAGLLADGERIKGIQRAHRTDAEPQGMDCRSILVGNSIRRCLVHSRKIRLQGLRFGAIEAHHGQAGQENRPFMLVQAAHRIRPGTRCRIVPGRTGRDHTGEIRRRGRQDQSGVGISNAQQTALTIFFDQHQVQFLPLIRPGAEHPGGKGGGRRIYRQDADACLAIRPGITQERQRQHAAPERLVGIRFLGRREDKAVGQVLQGRTIRAHADKAHLRTQLIPSFPVGQEDQFLHPHTSFIAFSIRDCTRLISGAALSTGAWAICFIACFTVSVVFGYTS